MKVHLNTTLSETMSFEEEKKNKMAKAAPNDVSILPFDPNLSPDDQDAFHQRINRLNGVTDDASLPHFSPLALLGLSFAVLNTWAASSGTIYIGMAAGGPTSILYGTIAGTLGALTIALSLAELCHVMPTKGAQYHWTYLLSSQKNAFAPFLSYLCGWLGTAGWICLTSTAPFLCAQTILINIDLFHPTFAPGIWLLFLIYMAFSVYAVLVNIYGIKLLNKMNSTALFWSVIGCLITTITLLSASSARGTMRDAKFIFTQFYNFTGWPNGVAWLIGLLQTQYALVGADGATHIIGEIANPRKNVPVAMVLSCLVGGASAFVVLIAFLAATPNDPLDIIAAQGGGAFLILVNAIGNKIGATVIEAIFLVNQIFTAPALVITCTRMLQAFAYDGCLPGKARLSAVNKQTETPVYAALFNLVCLTVFGLIMFGSTIAVGALQSASVVMLQLSYAPSIALQLFRGRKAIRNSNTDMAGLLRLGPVWGPILNICALSYITLTTVIFLLPPVIPVVSGSMMNYACVVLLLVVLLAVLNWFLYAKRHFSGPAQVL